MAEEKKKPGGFNIDVGGILEGFGLGGKGKGLGGLINTLVELAEKGEALSKTGELDIEGLKGKKGKAMYGFTVRTLAPEDPGYKTKPFTVSHFGNVKKDKQGKAVVEEVREPMVDIFDEKDHVLLVAEIPGVDEENVKVEIKEDILVLSAEKGERKYNKEVLLPAVVDAASMTKTFKNGVLEIKLMKKAK